jgi:hypothetical protein
MISGTRTAPKSESCLTAERLREALYYDPDTGTFRWRTSGHGRRAGNVAGCVNRLTGYRRIGIDGQQYLAQRLACFYMTGKWPSGQIDHLDWNEDNNAYQNLQDVTSAQNSSNCRPKSPLAASQPQPLWALTSEIREARELLGWSVIDLARRANVASRTVQRCENAGDTPRMNVRTLERLRRAFEAAGIEFIEISTRSNGGGLGVRFRK